MSNVGSPITKGVNADGTITIRCSTCGRRIKNSVYAGYSTVECIICQRFGEGIDDPAQAEEVRKLETELNYLYGPRPEKELTSLYNTEEKTKESAHEEKVGLVKSFFRALGFKRAVPTQEQREELASVRVAKSKKNQPLFGGYGGNKPKQM